MATFLSGVWNSVTKNIHIVHANAAPSSEDVKTRGDESSSTNTQSGSRHNSDSGHQARHDTAVCDIHLDAEVSCADKRNEITQVTTQDESNDNHSKLHSAFSSNLAATNTESHNEKRKGRLWTNEEDALLRTLYKTHGTRWTEIAQHLPGRSHNGIERRCGRLSLEANSELDLINIASSHSSKRVTTPPLLISKPHGDNVVASIGNLQKDLVSNRFSAAERVNRLHIRKEGKHGLVAQHRLKTRTCKEIDAVNNHGMNKSHPSKRHRPHGAFTDPNSKQTDPSHVPISRINGSKIGPLVQPIGLIQKDDGATPLPPKESLESLPSGEISRESQDSSSKQATRSGTHGDGSYGDVMQIVGNENNETFQFEVLDQFMQEMNRDHANTMNYLADFEKSMDNALSKLTRELEESTNRSSFLVEKLSDP